jgi:hypothetical protein
MGGLVRSWEAERGSVCMCVWGGGGRGRKIRGLRSSLLTGLLRSFKTQGSAYRFCISFPHTLSTHTTTGINRFIFGVS